MSYVFQEYPKWVYSHVQKARVIAKDAAEEALHSTRPEASQKKSPDSSGERSKQKNVDD